MQGPQTIPFLPAYIPPGVDVNKINADVGADGVSAPATDLPGLRQVVADAKKKGIDLKIVVIADSPPIDTPLRDIATEVGHAYPGSTVLALSPSFAGTYSPAFDRVTLEAGQDLAKTGNPVQSAHNFVGELTTPQFPWTALTIVLVIAVVAATVATRLLQLRSKPADAPAAGTEPAS
ncbi:MAG: hypothetical protein JO044_18045 [Mycobacteriaceae bacterium]|nr:hypothetical protein [Mycobacteriaceae bacterium]MBV9638494.1 hypothetical protein [Mycobacteriaceae bacterium]